MINNCFKVYLSILQGESQWFWGVNEIQEADQRSAIRFEPDPKSAFHTVVVSHNQQSQRKYLMIGLSWKGSLVLKDCDELFKIEPEKYKMYILFWGGIYDFRNG